LWLAATAQAATFPAEPDPGLQQVLRVSAAATARRHRAQQPRLHVTLVDLADEAHPRRASLGGDRPVFAASLVKLAFAAAYYDAVRTGRLRADPREEDLVRRSLGPYDNRAPSALVDLVTGTRAGRALRGAELADFLDKRQAATRLLERHGIYGIRALHKLAPARGRERQLYRLGANRVTADDVAKLLWLLWRGELVDRQASERMLSFLRHDAGGKRDLVAYPIASGLPAGVQVHSKAGWTRSYAHDAALIRPQRGGALLLVALSQVRFPGAQLATLAGEIYRRLR
jgi:hypothetical protein